LTVVYVVSNTYDVYRSEKASIMGGTRAVLRSEEAYQRIKSMIMSGELPQGAVVTEAELVRQLGMSRTPVREALRHLRAEQLLESVPGVGYRVTELDERDMVNVYMVRAALEGLAAEHAASLATRTDLARLEDLYEEMEEALARRDDAALARLNSRFHDAIAQASGNTYLQGMLNNIREIFERFRLTALGLSGRREEAHVEHGELVEALRARDGKRARAIAEAHVHRALQVRRDRAHRPADGDEAKGGDR